MDHYFNWEYNSRDTSEGTRKWSREGVRAKMRMLYQGGHDQMLQIAWSTVQSPGEANLCLRALSRGYKGGGFIHGLCLPWPEVIFRALVSSPNDLRRCPCTGAMAVSMRPQDGRREVCVGGCYPPVPMWSWPDSRYEWSKTGEAKGTWNDAKVASSSLLFSLFYRWKQNKTKQKQT